MPKTAAKTAADYILPLCINGLEGRLLRMPPPKGSNNEILFVYGHHSSLERMFGIVASMNKYAGVTMPDLPGFGGMETFYKLGKKPTLDNMADYLAAFVKLKFKNKRFKLAGLSYGFLVVTRMLQKYPEIAKQVDLLCSVVGFASKDDFVFKKRNYYIMRAGTAALSRRLPAAFIKHFILRAPLIRLGYRVGEAIAFNDKLNEFNEKNRKERIDFEIYLWQCNDLRTYMYTGLTMFKVQPLPIKVNLPVHHVGIDNDRYFNNALVEEHLRKIFTDFTMYKTPITNHSPSVIATADDAAPLMPKELIKLIKAKP